MEFLTGKLFLIPLFFALLCELRASALAYRLKHKYQVNVRRNYFGRIGISELRVAYNSFEDPNAKRIMLKLIAVKKWIFIWLGIAAFAFLIQRYVLN
jgi:hypothetical protein